MNFIDKTLKNGLRLIYSPMEGTKTVTVLAIFGTGSKYENRENNGISHFLEHMIFKGTEKRPTTMDIASELDGVGADFNAFTAKEYTGYWVKVNKEKLNLALDIVSDMLLNSKFDEQEIDREKGVIIEEINMYEDNPMMSIEDVFENCLYGDTPAGWDVAGPKENILKMQRKDFITYFNSQYGTNQSTVCLAGNITKEVEEKVEKYFAELRMNDFQDKEKTIEKQSEPKVKIKYKDTDQTTISLGVRAYPVGHKDEMALKMLAIILGGSMSSRMFTEIRERRGLAYYVKTAAELYTDTGFLTTQAGLNSEKLDEAVKTIIDEYKKIAQQGVAEKELQKNKDLLKGRIILQLESSENVANWYGKQAVLQKKIQSPTDMFEKIDKLQTEDIQKVAKDIFVNSSLNLAIIGKFKDEKKFLEILKL